MRFIPALLSATLAACLPLAPAGSAEPGTQSSSPTSPDTPPASGAAPVEPGFTTQLFASSRTSLLGDAFGLRPALGRYGLSLGLQEISEVFGNFRGGTRRGAEYDGLTSLSLGLDTQKAFGWEGGTVNISAFQIHGRDVSAENLRLLQNPSGIAATRSTRIWELWVQQAFFGNRADIKLGQQSLDEEFSGSTLAGTFLNTAMGWPALSAYDLYAGGPAYPLSSLGVRVRVRPSGAVTALAGVFDDNAPGGPFNDDSQLRGAAQSGTTFHLGTGALVFAEIQYARNQPAEGDDATAGGGGLPGTYKVGAWFDTGAFPDPRRDTAGLSVADPASSGLARQRRGNYSVYGIADQTIWQPDPDRPRNVSVFARAMGSSSDRNLVDFVFTAGMVLHAPLPGRDNDNLGLGYGLTRVGANAAALQRDAAVFTGTPTPVPSSESFIELTYIVQVAPWLQIQPDAQFVFLPSGGVANPARPGARVGNEAILGLRTAIIF